MKILKAIELNEASYQSLANHKFPDHADAIKLGNEALKQRQQLIKNYPHLPWPKLPGED